MLPHLEALYASEPDGLFWHAGESAHPALNEALQALGRVDTQGLDPADYDVPLLAKRWEAMKATAPSATDRALFDLALTVSSMRLLSSAREGRVDPRLVGFDYEAKKEIVDGIASYRKAKKKPAF